MEFPKFALPSVGAICLGVYLLLIGISALVGLAIPAWVAACFACAAGLFILIGR